MNYQCKIDIYEGPLDLLLHLIKEQKMDVHDIPIAKITRQYLDHLELMRDLNLEVAGDYLVMAAELTRIKSRMLLPAPETEEEGEEGEDPRAELTRRLLEYQRYKNAAFELRLREHERQQVFTRGSDIPVEESSEEEVLIDATVFDLLTAFQNVLKEKSFRKDYEIEITTVSVADRMNDILEILNASESAVFEALFTPLNTKQEIIATFLALLELMRLHLVRVQQGAHFEPIRIYPTSDQDTQQEILQRYNESREKEEET